MNCSIATKLALIPVWINNYIRFKMCDENTYPSSNCNGAAVEVWEWVSDFITLYWACDYLSMLWHKFTYVNARCPSNPFSTFSLIAKNSIGTSSEYVHEITNNYTPYFLWHVIIHHCPNLTAIYLKHHWKSLSLKRFREWIYGNTNFSWNFDSKWKKMGLQHCIYTSTFETCLFLISTICVTQHSKTIKCMTFKV